MGKEKVFGWEIGPKLSESLFLITSILFGLAMPIFVLVLRDSRKRVFASYDYFFGFLSFLVCLWWGVVVSWEIATGFENISLQSILIASGIFSAFFLYWVFNKGSSVLTPGLVNDEGDDNFVPVVVQQGAFGKRKKRPARKSSPRTRVR